MVAARILFVFSLLGLVGAVNALAKPNYDLGWALRPWWLFAVLTGELVPLRLAVRGILVGVLWRFGALEHRAGQMGLFLTAVTWVGYLVLMRRAANARGVVSSTLDAAGSAPIEPMRPRWPRILIGYPYRVPAGIARIEDIEYRPGLHMDMYRNGDDPRPLLLQIHGGSWRAGNRRQQARPLLHGLAERGWLTAAASYPFVPDASAVDQLIALKGAINWFRVEGPQHGIDPSFIAVTGGSAGAHLASLLALTPNRPEYQPGFEEVDTAVQAAVPFYGIYDLVNRNRTRDDWPIVAQLMRATPSEAGSCYREASPLDQVGPQAPPFLVIHGENDSVVSSAEADQFVTALRQASTQPVVHIKLPGANHGFDLVYSVRTHHVVNGVERFLLGVRQETTRPLAGP